jgi:hypothetical protein
LFTLPNLQVAVLVEQDVAGLQVTMDDASRVNVLEGAKNLVQEVLDVLCLQLLL